MLRKPGLYMSWLLAAQLPLRSKVSLPVRPLAHSRRGICDQQVHIANMDFLIGIEGADFVLMAADCSQVRCTFLARS